MGVGYKPGRETHGGPGVVRVLVRFFLRAGLLSGVVALSSSLHFAQSGPTVPPPNPVADVAALVARLDLARYKSTIKGLTQFGDRLQGTERNRRAVNWIEAQLRSYGCPTERLRYVQPPPAPAAAAGRAGGTPPAAR
jgi:hypothetical protein